MNAMQRSSPRDNETSSDDKPMRLLDIFDQLESGLIDEDGAVEALRERRERRHGRVGRFLEALTS
jgi:hypothetical protein